MQLCLTWMILSTSRCSTRMEPPCQTDASASISVPSRGVAQRASNPSLAAPWPQAEALQCPLPDELLTIVDKPAAPATEEAQMSL